MDKQWFKFTIPVPAQLSDLVTAMLYEQGCEGITVAEHSLDTFILPDPDSFSDEDAQLKAYFECDDPVLLKSTLCDHFAKLSAFEPQLKEITFQFEPVVLEDWAEGWKQYFQPFRVGSVLVKPSWEDVEPLPDEAVVTIDPGMAFGTGTHATTRLCLEVISRRFARCGLHRMLDAGTGSGILAICAAVIGCNDIVACDIDPVACETAKKNAQANDVLSQVQVTDQKIEAMGGVFDLIVANILAEENIRLARNFDRLLADQGELVLSGILEEKAATVISAFQTIGFDTPEILRQDEWVCLSMKRKK